MIIVWTSKTDQTLDYQDHLPPPPLHANWQLYNWPTPGQHLLNIIDKHAHEWVWYQKGAHSVTDEGKIRNVIKITKNLYNYFLPLIISQNLFAEVSDLTMGLMVPWMTSCLRNVIRVLNKTIFEAETASLFLLVTFKNICKCLNYWFCFNCKRLTCL